MENNIPVINIEQFKEIIRLQFLEGNTRPVFGLGKGGIGKSDAIRTLATELDIGYIDIRLLTYSEVDLKGIPYPNETHTKSIWLQNDILPIAARDGHKGILVLDEITSVARSVRTAAYQLLNERKLGDYLLPPGWLIVCLGNGEEDGGDFQGMEGNFVNRCSIFKIVPNVAIWKNWAYKNNINPLVLSYIGWRNDELHTYRPDTDTELAFASPRAWVAVSDILNRYGYHENDTLTRLRILSNVGVKTGEQFWAFCKYHEETPDVAEILNGTITESPDLGGEILYITLQSLISRLSELFDADKNLDGALQESTINQCACAIKWILSLPAMEDKVSGLKDLSARNPALITALFLNDSFSEKCPALEQFALENQSVFKK